jgi:hypothetical protein
MSSYLTTLAQRAAGLMPEHAPRPALGPDSLPFMSERVRSPESWPPQVASTPYNTAPAAPSQRSAAEPGVLPQAISSEPVELAESTIEEATTARPQDSVTSHVAGDPPPE